MSAGDFWLMGEDGLPETFIDAAALTANARQIVRELMACAHEEQQVVAVISERVMAIDARDNAKLLLATAVIDNLVADALKPLLADVAAENLRLQQQLEVAQSAHSTAAANARGQASVRESILRAQQRADFTKDSRGPQHGDSSSESEH